ncbi:hypothetical protein LTR56_009569 [Elasticomyces elasticus]|nr:hypothetical protein LTR56_009569 [Elasticomyces elasticus]KAK3657249.1 hypothetical protein LTR22_009423 [Elasticomyces elasticus]KAK4922204.1 hypothetical protein LTR49_010425 [Elasticomyces elasticus]KAK5760857.1 hypothetical protein LTS12_009033 [Elasticomyces elasticus]
MAHQDLWAFSQESSNFIVNIACVVKHPNGKWRGFFSAKGFYDHLRQGHGESNKGVGLTQIIERCQVRELSESEVEDVRKAGPDSIKSVATSTAVTQKKKQARANNKAIKNGFGGRKEIAEAGRTSDNGDVKVAEQAQARTLDEDYED